MPRNAAEYWAWINSASGAVTAAARDPDEAFQWVARVEQEGVDVSSFQAVPEGFKSLDAKIRSAMSKHLSGKDAESARELVSHLHEKMDEMRKAAVPRRITGLQMLFLVTSYYRVPDTEKTAFELSAPMSLEYPGDDQMDWFKGRWDHLVRYLRTPLTHRDLEGILHKNI